MTSKFLRSMYNKTIVRFGFCDIQNNQGLGKGCQPQPLASADNPYLDLDYHVDIRETSSSNCLKSLHLRIDNRLRQMALSEQRRDKGRLSRYVEIF